MSQPISGTGKVVTAWCGACSTMQDADECVGLYDGLPVYQAREHKAPCGLLCMGGGARGKEGLEQYRAGLVHGSSMKGCPKCNPKEARLSEPDPDDEDAFWRIQDKLKEMGWPYTPRPTVAIEQKGGPDPAAETTNCCPTATKETEMKSLLPLLVMAALAVLLAGLLVSAGGCAGPGGPTENHAVAASTPPEDAAEPVVVTASHVTCYSGGSLLNDLTPTEPITITQGGVWQVPTEAGVVVLTADCTSTP